MKGELIGAGVGLILAVIVGAAGWFGRQQHGAAREKLKQAERERDDLRQQAEESSVAPANPDEASEILRRRLDRLARRGKRVHDEANRLE